jgi:DNA end-binding protein Ku
MPRPVWSGSIAFGLVNIPVKMYGAVKDKDVHFHLLHEKDNARVKQKLVCPAENNKEVDREDTVRGFELDKEHLAVIKPEELEALAPKASHTLDLLDFVELASIDPVYFQQPYYLVPDERAGKAYHLLFEAMKRSKKVGIASFVMRNKQYLAALRPIESAICLETMYFSDEIVDAKKIEEFPKKGAASAREIEMAEKLIESLTKPFRPEKYHDDYREAVLDLVEKKAKGKKIATQAPESDKGPKIVDLMSALQASLQETTKKKKKHAA